jgi:hypothetical protein
MPVHGKYTVTCSDIQIDLGFKPKYVKVTSAEGVAEYHERGEGWFKQIAATGVFSVETTDSFEFGDLYLKVVGTDDVVNKAAVDYFYEAY